MGYNYCLIIAKKEVVGLVLEVLKKEKLSAKLITKSDGGELVINEKSLISYLGRSFPDLEEIFPGKTLTLYVDGRAASYDIQGNWDLASAFNAGISLQMGLSLKSTDLKKVKNEKEIAKILSDLKSSDTFDDLQKDDGVELQTNSVTIESKEDFFKLQQLSNLLEKLSQLLIDKNIDHYVAWFEDGFSNSSGDLDGNLLYPVVYADAFWTEDGVNHQLHVTHTEIFQE
jgi:hypothetical protein